MRKMTLAIAATLLAATALAQDFPVKPLHIVVPNPAGGTVDIVARAVAQGLGASLGQPVVIDVKPGGNNIIGSEAVARAAPDGYTLLMGGTHVTINPLMRKLPYDGLNAFTPVALLAATPNVIAVGASVPARNIAELVALAKSRPGALNCATSTAGNGIHLAAERFRTAAGLEWNFVPFQGGVQAALAVAGGHAEVLVAPLSDAMPHFASGKLRILAVTSPQRFEAIREVPTLAESGFPGFQALQWFGALAPAGTPKPVVARLSAEMRRALENPEVRASFAKLGITVMPMAPEQFDEFLRTETRAFAVVIREGNIRAE
ncbi:MAG TPA: tripartite tricarboxylate transporter substrate binding protein [Usitatibacter sp.]|nr:tripartite tricarboxylate transporter substrate binding protein [Usitatibacter sp.]